MKLNLETTQNIINELEKVYDLLNATSSSNLTSLAKFIKECFGSLELEDIETAFKKVLSGQIKVDLAVSGGLNALKIGKVLHAFQEFKQKNNMIQEVEKPEPTEAEKEEMFKQFDAFLCDQFEGYCKYGFHQILTGSFCYTYLENKGVIEKDMYLKFLDKASDKPIDRPFEVEFMTDDIKEIKKINARKAAFNHYFKELAIAGKRLNDYIYN